MARWAGAAICSRLGTRDAAHESETKARPDCLEVLEVRVFLTKIVDCLDCLWAFNRILLRFYLKTGVLRGLRRS